PRLLGDPPLPNSIAGSVFNDVSGNGIKDAGDAVLSGATLYLDSNKNGKRDLGEKTTTSNAAGAYTFTGLTKGTYRVRQVVPSGKRISTPVATYFDVPLTSGQK